MKEEGDVVLLKEIKKEKNTEERLIQPKLRTSTESETRKRILPATLKRKISPFTLVGDPMKRRRTNEIDLLSPNMGKSPVAPSPLASTPFSFSLKPHHPLATSSSFSPSSEPSVSHSTLTPPIANSTPPPPPGPSSLSQNIGSAPKMRSSYVSKTTNRESDWVISETSWITKKSPTPHRPSSLSQNIVASHTDTTLSQSPSFSSSSLPKVVCHSQSTPDTPQQIYTSNVVNSIQHTSLSTSSFPAPNSQLSCSNVSSYIQCERSGATREMVYSKFPSERYLPNPV